jgi:hypothetical protein
MEGILECTLWLNQTEKISANRAEMLNSEEVLF